MRDLIAIKSYKFLIGAVMMVLSLASAVAGDTTPMINADGEKIAIRGYDPVAYFTLGQPTMGKPEISFSWREADWQFANTEHRDRFAANPDRYAPQYGGFCAMAMTEGVIKVIDPEAWSIVDGKLYLNFSQTGRTYFRADLPGNIEKSDGHWVRLHTQN